MIKKILWLGLGLVVGLGAVLVVRTLTFQPATVSSSKTENHFAPDGARVSANLSRAIQFQTVSHEDSADKDAEQFNGFIRWLADTYPQVHQRLELQTLNQHTLLYRWAGKDAALPAVLLSAHYDVVPVIPGTENDWTHPPFDGVIADGYVWGRGALDDKSAVIALMESATLLVEQGHQPNRDIYLAFTADEERGGDEGAGAITAMLSQRGVQLAWSLDEGSFVLQGLLPGVDKPFASINVAEKGYLTLELIAHGQGGHSSMPPKETAVSILASAITRLTQNAVPGGLSGLSEQMYVEVGRHMGFGKRLLFANMWLFRPLIENIMGEIPSGNAMLRTTMAPTMLSGSVKSNVLPIVATAKINFRLHPRDTVQSLTDWVRATIDDERIEINASESNEASAIASSDTVGFAQIADQARQVHGDVIVAPGLTIAATDSSYYSRITDAYRFNPMVIGSQDVAGFHGTNERISTDNMVKAVAFYAGLMQQQ